MNPPVSRRSALTALGVALLGGVAGYIYGRNTDAAESQASGTYDGRSAAAPGRPLARVADIPQGGGVIDAGMVVCRLNGDTVRAYSATCTHLGCEVNRVADNKIFCPCHGSVFDATSGAVIQGPASRPLPPARVSVRNGEVFSG